MGRTTRRGDGPHGTRRPGTGSPSGAADVTALLRQFIEQDYVKVVAAVGLITHDRDRAEEAVQDAMVRLLTERGPDDDTPVATWVTATASTTPADEVPVSPEELVGADEADALVAAVHRLPLEQRQVAVMRYYLDESVVDIAAGMGVPADQVAADLRDADAAVTITLDAADGAGAAQQGQAS